jgi:hypothetical protein
MQPTLKAQKRLDHLVSLSSVAQELPLAATVSKVAAFPILQLHRLPI